MNSRGMDSVPSLRAHDGHPTDRSGEERRLRPYLPPHYLVIRNRGRIERGAVPNEYYARIAKMAPPRQRRPWIADDHPFDLDETLRRKRRCIDDAVQRREYIVAAGVHPCGDQSTGRAARALRQRLER